MIGTAPGMSNTCLATDAPSSTRYDTASATATTLNQRIDQGTGMLPPTRRASGPSMIDRAPAPGQTDSAVSGAAGGYGAPMTLVESILAGDRAAAVAALGAHPDSAAAVDDAGVSALLLAHYRGLDEVVDAIRALRPLDLPEAAAVGDVRRVGALLAVGLPPDEPSPDGFSPVQLALFFDQPAAAAVLIRAGADVDAPATHPMGIAAVHAAAASPTGAGLALAVAAGADLDATQSGGFTPLHEAAHRGTRPWSICSSRPAQTPPDAPTTGAPRPTWLAPTVTTRSPTVSRRTDSAGLTSGRRRAGAHGCPRPPRWVDARAHRGRRPAGAVVCPGRRPRPLRERPRRVAARREPVELVPGTRRLPRWDFELVTRTGADGALDVGGPFAQGRRGDRFVYLTWGTVAADGAFTMFRRAKLHLADVDPGVLARAAAGEGRLVARLGLTDTYGNPVRARVRPPAVSVELRLSRSLTPTGRRGRRRGGAARRCRDSRGGRW